MDEDYIDGLVALMRRQGLAELEHEADGQRVRLRLAGAGGVALARGTAELAPVAAAAGKDDAGQTDTGAGAAGRIEVRAGMPGHFYRAPAPDADPFIDIGSVVAPGQTLALLEAMKMLTPVEAEQAAEVVEILVENAAPVVRGDLLMVLKAAS